MANEIKVNVNTEYKQLVADWNKFDKKTAFIRMLSLFAAYQTLETSYMLELLQVYKENEDLKNKLKKHTYKRKKRAK